MLAGLSGDNAPSQHEFLVVPERAVVDTGSKKVVYVEREPGMFEGVEVELGPRQGEYYPVIKGLKRGRQGGRRGRLPDRRRNAAQPGRRLDLLRRQRRPAVQRSSQAHRRLPASARAIKPRPIKTNRIRPSRRRSRSQGWRSPRLTTKTSRTSSNCPRPTGNWHSTQRICPVTGAALGSMGVPVKITLRGQPVFLCCKGCIGKAKRSPDEMLKKLADAAHASRR